VLATGKGLTLVGDAASIAGRPIDEVAVSIGRVANALTSGTSAGEAVNRLQELALISGKTKLEFERLAEAQKKGRAPILSQLEALTLLSEKMSKVSGAMKELSKTTEGKISNLKDSWQQLKVSIGTGVNEGLKTGLDAANELIPKFMDASKRIGDVFGRAFSDSVLGNTDTFSEAGRLLGEKMMIGLKASFGIGLANLFHDVMQSVEKWNPIRWIANDIDRGMGREENRGRAGSDFWRERSNMRYKEFVNANDALKPRVKNITEGRTGLIPGYNGSIRYARPGEDTTGFEDVYNYETKEWSKATKVSNGLLEKIELNTRAGAKF
jgi:hypothetical protein